MARKTAASHSTNYLYTRTRGIYWLTRSAIFSTLEIFCLCNARAPIEALFSSSVLSCVLVADVLFLFLDTAIVHKSSTHTIKLKSYITTGDPRGTKRTYDMISPAQCLGLPKINIPTFTKSFVYTSSHQ